MKKLISMTDFVLSDEWSALNEYNFIKVIEYAKFLKQPLELWMFMPCDEYGNVLEESVMFKILGDVDGDLEQIQYQQAKEKCLFVWVEGFDYEGICEMFTDLENIIDFDFKLTKTAIKQIGL